jgi:glycosyltransferase involved in cell wall biosynthesis
LLTDGYRPGVNGVIRFISLHKRTLEELGHEVFVFTWGREDPGDEDGVLRSFGLPFVKPGYYVGLGYDRDAVSVMRTLDLLHANQPVLSGIMALRYGRRYDLPLVLSCHTRYDLLGTMRLPVLPLSAYRAVLRPVLRWCADQFDVVTAPTPEAMRVMKNLGVSSPMEVVPYGVELARCREPATRLKREELGLPTSAPLALFVGRLAPEKNVRFLLKALARPELANAYLLIVGDGDERQSLEELASEMDLEARVRFVGQVPPADVPAYANLANLFVTASRIEMLPIAVIEALAAGLPIVGLDVYWIRHVVQPNVNGLLADCKMESFAQAWAELLHNEALRRRLAEGARATGEQYDVQRTTAQMVAHYEQLMDSQRRGADE